MITNSKYSSKSRTGMTKDQLIASLKSELRDEKRRCKATEALLSDAIQQLTDIINEKADGFEIHVVPIHK